MKKVRMLVAFCITASILISTPTLSADTTLIRILRNTGETRRSDQLPLVIFDLDGTLFYTGFRSKQIFLEFAQSEDDTSLERKVHSIDPVSMKYRVRKSLVESGISDSTLLKEMIDSWRTKFFSDDYLVFDEHLPGSVAFLKALHDSGAHIVYLTGRDAPGMLVGTVASLQEHGFPIGIARTELIMKPERYQKTLHFKKQVLPYLEKLGMVIAIFENEPEIINLLIERFPHAIACFLETQHKPDAPRVFETAHRLKHYRINLSLKPTGDLKQETE